MTDLYQQLVQDHITFTKVLNALERSISHFKEESEHEPNLPLILDTLEYIQVYPEKFHHPLEEQAFNYLLTHHLGDEQIISEIREQHKSLEKKTAYLSKQFNAIANDYVIPMSELHSHIEQFISAQKHHIETENRKIFPILSKLNEQAWWDIASGLIIKGDPLFDNDSGRQPFAALATAIIQEQHEHVSGF